MTVMLREPPGGIVNGLGTVVVGDVGKLQNPQDSFMAENMGCASHDTPLSKIGLGVTFCRVVPPGAQTYCGE